MTCEERLTQALTRCEMALVRHRVEQWGACVALRDGIGNLVIPAGVAEAWLDLSGVNRAHYVTFDLGDFTDKVMALILALMSEVKQRDKEIEELKNTSQHDLTKTQELVKTQAGYMKNYQEYIAFLEADLRGTGRDIDELCDNFRAAQKDGSIAIAVEASLTLPRAKLVPNTRPVMGSHGDTAAEPEPPAPIEPDATPIARADFPDGAYFGRLQ
jgi:hypothetical protein